MRNLSGCISRSVMVAAIGGGMWMFQGVCSTVLRWAVRCLIRVLGCFCFAGCRSRWWGSFDAVGWVLIVRVRVLFFSVLFLLFFAGFWVLVLDDGGVGWFCGGLGGGQLGVVMVQGSRLGSSK